MSIGRSQSLVMTCLSQAGSVRLAGDGGRVGEPADATTQLHQPSPGRPVPAGSGATRPVRQPARAAERPPTPGDAAGARRRQEQVGSQWRRHGSFGGGGGGGRISEPT